MAMRALRAAMLVAAVLTHGVGGEGEECRIEIVSPETGDTLPAGAGLVLEFGLVDCPVPCPARRAPRVLCLCLRAAVLTPGG